MGLNVPRAQAVRVHHDDLVVETWKTPLVHADQVY
jgi:hypothetical protein